MPGGLATLSLAVVLGLVLGAVRFRGFKLGIAAVLFAGLLFGQIGLAVDEHVLEFLRDFALITFVYSIGLQVGPGFLASLRAGINEYLYPPLQEPLRRALEKRSAERIRCHPPVRKRSRGTAYPNSGRTSGRRASS